MRTELSVHTAGFPTPISPEAGPMPADEGLGIIAMALRTDGSHRYSWTRNKRSPVGEVNTTTHLPPQYDQLASEQRVLCLKSPLRLERRGEQGQEEA